MKEQYKLLLLQYIAHDDETSLELAYELGRKAIEKGISVLELINTHNEFLGELLTGSNTSESSIAVVDKAASILKETLAPYEMTRLGFLDTISLLRDQNEKLTNLMEEKSILLKQREDFMMVVTHDLKTPITAAAGCLSLMLDGDFGELNPTMQSVVTSMKDSNQKMFTMVKNLLEAYRYEQSAPVLNIRKLDLGPVLQSAARDFSMSAQMRGINLVTKLDQDLPFVYADDMAISHVLNNLLDNAIKFTPEDGSITVAAKEIDNQLLVEVADTGRGISQEDQARLFQRFFQSDLGRKQYTGTGIGLYLCQEIVKAHGSQINCSSEPGAGTTFSFRLPVFQTD